MYLKVEMKIILILCAYLVLASCQQPGGDFRGYWQSGEDMQTKICRLDSTEIIWYVPGMGTINYTLRVEADTIYQFTTPAMNETVSHFLRQEKRGTMQYYTNADYITFHKISEEQAIREMTRLEELSGRE